MINTFFHSLGFASLGFGSLAPQILLLAALLLDAIAGNWIERVLPDPAALSARFYQATDRRLNRPGRGGAALMALGMVVMLFMLLAAGALGLAIERIAGWEWGWTLEILALLTCLRGRAAWTRAHAVGLALGNQNLLTARMLAAAMTSRYTHGMDGHGVARIAIEHAAKAFDRALVAPAFWYLLLGVPGMLVWSVISGAEAVFGRLRHERFGSIAIRLDDALNALPARLAGALLALAALFLGSTRASKAFTTIGRDAGKHPSFNMGWPIAASAGALGLALLGPYRDGGVTVTEPWIGDGRATATAADINGMLGLMAVADLLLMLVVALLTLLFAR